MMKKTISFFLAMVLSILFVACGTVEVDDEGNKFSITKLTKNNYEDYFSFEVIKDNSKVSEGDKHIDLTFELKEVKDVVLENLSVTIDATVYFRCNDGDIDEYVEQGIVLSESNKQKTIKFSRDNIINYNGTIVESISYEVKEVSGTAKKPQ